MSELKEVQQYAQDLKSRHSARNAMDNEMENIFLMTWDETGRIRRRDEDAKITTSPRSRNSLLGAQRLLTVTEPTFSISKDVNTEYVVQYGEGLEQAALQLWTAAGRIRKRPLHFDVVLTALLFGEMHIAVTRTADMVAYAKGANKTAQMHAERVAMTTPYIFDVYDPRSGYPELTPSGLVAYYREVATTSGAIMDDFGSKGEALMKGSRYQPVTLCHFWDVKNHYVWLDGRKKDALIEEEHGLPMIPIVVQLGEGSMLFSKPEWQRQPFLYSEWKSELYKRENLALTVLYTNLFKMGMNPMYVETLNQLGEHATVDADTGRVTVPFGGGWSPLPSKGIIDPGARELLDMAAQLEQESTIYAQTLGEPLGGNAPFSTVALLHQSGRLPLATPQKLAGWAIADAVKCALLWWRNEPESLYDYAGALSDITPAEIPEAFDMDCKLDIALPQDRLQQANVANIMTQGDDPLVSKQWVLENVLNIGAPDKMRKEVWGEKASFLAAQSYFVDQLMQLQAKTQALMQPQQMQQGPPPGMQPGQPPPGPEQQGPGLQGGLPPEMAQMGGQPGQPMPGQNIPPELLAQQQGGNGNGNVPPGM